MTRSDKCEEAANGFMQQQQQQQEQQQHQFEPLQKNREWVGDNQNLSKNERNIKNRKKHPVYQKSVKRGGGCGSAVRKEQLQKDPIKDQCKRDNIEQNCDVSNKTASSNDIPDSWELLYDLDDASDHGSVAPSDGLLMMVAMSVEQVFAAANECHPLWNFDDDFKEQIPKVEIKEDDFFDNSIGKQQLIVNASSSRAENISMRFLLHPHMLKSSKSDSLDSSIAAVSNDLTLDSSLRSVDSETSFQLANNYLNTDEKSDFVQNVVEPKCTAKEQREAAPTSVNDLTINLTNVKEQQSVHSETCSWQWDDCMDDNLASVTNEIESPLNRSSYAENEQSSQKCYVDPYKNWMERPRRGTLRAVRYKTEMCRRYEEGLPCTYGIRCQFAHGFHELRFQPRHPKHKTELCHMFHSMGICRYGRRCSFVHTENLTLLPQTLFNHYVYRYQHPQQPQQQQLLHQLQRHHIYVGDSNNNAANGLTICYAETSNKVQSACQEIFPKNQAKETIYEDSESSNSLCLDNSRPGDITATVTDSNDENIIGEEQSKTSTKSDVRKSQQVEFDTFTAEPQKQQINQTEMVTIDHSSAQEELPNSTPNIRHKNHGYVNGNLPAANAAFAGAGALNVPWTNATVYYTPYEGANRYYHNTAGGQVTMRYCSNSNACNFYGQQSQHQIVQATAATTLAIPAYQASNGVVYFNNALRTMPSYASTSTSTAAISLTTMPTVVNTMPVYVPATSAAPYYHHHYYVAATAADPRHIFEQSQTCFGNYYAAVTPNSQIYYQIMPPHLGALPHASNNVYHVMTAASNNPYCRPSDGNKAYTTHA